MIDQEQEQDEAWTTRRRRAGIAAFVVGAVVALAFFAFFPGLPHIIDWGAILVSVAVGTLIRWICQSWMTKRRKELM
ncbi:hypothetical protein [Streptomyces sp. NPDC004520]|uniref:hypothetical protein n=1 Tax=unclassified Streptomyces TaxID=2593676 RepID=UPI0036C7B63A